MNPNSVFYRDRLHRAIRLDDALRSGDVVRNEQVALNRLVRDISRAAPSAAVVDIIEQRNAEDAMGARMCDSDCDGMS